MLETIIVILLLMWLLGMVTGQMFGNFLHLLLVVALVVFIVRLLTGRRTL
ncbi:MAG: lmo0937 family membrane protein [Pyrinomonadaceae bacterium]